MRYRAIAVAFGVSTAVATAVLARPQQAGKPAGPNVNATAATLQDFKARVDHYMAVRRKVSGDAPPLKKTDDPAQIKAAEDGLGAAIRAARADAKPGDILTPDVQAVFRKLLAPELKGGDGQKAKEILKDDAPAAVSYKVNAKYPDGKPLPTVPANLLMNLPTLPHELEYRIIGRNLILRDTGADIIVDFMPNAFR